MRIISLSPSFTEILRDSGIGAECLVGITSHCPQDMAVKARRLGSPKALNLSEIEALSPDFIFAHEGENRQEQIHALQRKYRVVTFAVRSVPAVIDTVHAIARHLGKTDASEALENKIRNEYEENLRTFGGIRPVRTMILIWNQPYLTVNFDTYLSRLVEASGCFNVFHSDPLREFPVEMEDMLDKNPELLLLPTEPFPFTKRHIAMFRKYRTFSRIRIELIDGALFFRFGPKTIEALKTLRLVIGSLVPQ
jgi:ABC-type Fe3+-hydroxamate transport system substrate-binding protein